MVHETTLAELKQWEKGMYHLHGKNTQLREALLLMASDLGVTAYLKLPKNQWQTFFLKVECLMHKRPYHNFTHVCDVVQAVYSIITCSRLKSWLTQAETTALFIATVCHDLDHPGHSNILEKGEDTELSKKYSDSPLENHHADLAQQLIQELNLLAAVDADSRTSIISQTRNLILATDMAKHNIKIKELHVLLEDGVDSIASARHDSVKKCLLLQNLVKCADISNQARCQLAADFWNAAIYEEFYAEGDINRMRGRQVNPLHDRQTNIIPKSSLGFGGYVVKPMFELIHKFLKMAAKVDANILPTEMETALKTIMENSKRYAAETEHIESIQNPVATCKLKQQSDVVTETATGNVLEP